MQHEVVPPIVNEADMQFLLNKHALFQEILEKYGSPPAWSRVPGFETLIKIILEQQVSLASARAHFLRLRENLGEISPQTILAASDEQLRKSHLSRQKQQYVRALSEALVQKQLVLENLPDLPEAAVRSQLTQIKGIGNWTANVYLLLCLQRTDIFPIGDVALRNTLKEFTGLTSPEEMVLLAADWKPKRSLATFFCWHHYLQKTGKKLPE